MYIVHITLPPILKLGYFVAEDQRWARVIFPVSPRHQDSKQDYLSAISVSSSFPSIELDRGQSNLVQAILLSS